MGCCGTGKRKSLDLNQKFDILEQVEKVCCKKPAIQWPSQEKCFALKTELKAVLEAMGARGACINDFSMIEDMAGFWGVTEETPSEESEKVCQKKCQEISEKLGLALDEVQPTHYIVEVAQKLKERQ